MLLYYFYNMAQVIRKYDWGGNIDYAPVKIYGTYYDPVEFDKEVSRRAQEYAQNGNYSGEKWQKFQSSVEAMKKGLMNGTITMTGDGKFTGAGLNSVWDEDAGRFFYKNLVDNGFKSTHTEPQKYNLIDSFTTYVNDTYGDDWDELDKFDEKTGLRSTANRSTEFKKWLNAEKNKLNSDISYRRKYSYKGTDSDVANWATRHNLTVQDINDILYALEDNTISDEENKTLPIGLNLNQFLSTGKDSEYHKTFIANQEAKAKQAKQEQQAKRIANNVFTPDFLNSRSTFHFDGTDYLYSQFESLANNEEAQRILNSTYQSLQNNSSTQGLQGLQNFNYNYNVDLANLFPEAKLAGRGGDYHLVKAWSRHPANMDAGDYVLINPNTGETIKGNLGNDESGYFISYGDNQRLNLGQPQLYFDDSNALRRLVYTSVNNDNNNSKEIKVVKQVNEKDEPTGIYTIIDGDKKYTAKLRTGYEGHYKERVTMISRDQLNDDFTDLAEFIETGQKGIKIINVSAPEINSEQPVEEETPTKKTPYAGLSKSENLKQEIISGQELRYTDTERLIASGMDLVSSLLGFNPVTSIASAGLGALSSLGEARADWQDWKDNREGAQSLPSFAGELLLNLGMDAVSLIPGGKTFKTINNLRKFANFVPHIAGLIQAGVIMADENQRKDFTNTLNKIARVQLSSLNSKDIQNITYMIRSLQGAYKTPTTVKNVFKNTTKLEGSVDNISAQAIKNGEIVGDIKTSIDHSTYNNKFGFNFGKDKTQAKAVEAKYKSDVEAKAKADVEQSMQKNDGESDVDFKARKDAEIKKRVDEALKDVNYRITNIDTPSSRVSFEHQDNKGNENTWFTDAWFGRKLHDLSKSKHTETTPEPRRTTFEPEWGPSKIREELVGRNLMDDNIRSKSDEELAQLFPDIKSIDDYATTTIENNLVNYIKTAIPKIDKIPGWESNVRELNRSLNPNLDYNTRLQIIHDNQVNRLRTQFSRDTGQNLKRRKIQQDSDKLEAEKRKALRKQQYESKKSEANKARVSEQKGWSNTLNEYIDNHLPNDLKKFVREVSPKARRTILKMLREGKSKAEIQEAIANLKKEYKANLKAAAEVSYKQGGVIRKYQNSGQFTTLMMPDPYKTKLYDPNILNKFNNGATKWAESYLSALNSNSTTPQLEFTQEESDGLFVGNTIPVINTYDPIKKAEAKGYAEGLASVIRNSTIDSKQVTPTPGKDKYTFNPDMPTAYRLASLATNVFGNIAQTRNLIDNYRSFSRQPLQLSPVPVIGDYTSLQAGQTLAGNLRTAAKNASQSTSDARLGIASELTGNAQAMTPVMQAIKADRTARKQSQAVSQDVANENLAYAIKTANQNAFEYNKAHNYKTQLESQLIGLTAKNTNNFLKESQLKSEQLDAMMKKTEYKRRATDLSKTFESGLTKYANDNYLAKAKQYLTSKGTDISGMSDSSILDEYFKNNTLAYEEYQNYVDSQKNLFNSQLNNLQLEIYKGEPILSAQDYLDTDNRGNAIYGNPRRIFKKGGSVREKAVIQQIKDRNKDKLETKKSNAKSLRDSDREFNKTYRHLSAGTLALLKKAME